MAWREVVYVCTKGFLCSLFITMFERNYDEGISEYLIILHTNYNITADVLRLRQSLRLSQNRTQHNSTQIIDTSPRSVQVE